MDTYKAKNITIAFLLLLNAVLLICNMLFTDTDAYRMTTEAAGNIMQVLAMNNISITAKIDRDFSPKGRLETQSFAYDGDQLVGIFMRSPEQAELNVENNRHLYRSETESLSITGGYVVYRNRDAVFGIPERSFADGLCRELAKKISGIYGDFAPDMPQGEPYETDEGLVYEYRQTYRGYVINSTFLIVTVAENGISRVEFMCARVLGPFRDTRSIYAPDEVLLTAMHEIKNIYGDREVAVEGMDLAYHQFGGDASGPSYAVPVYRIYISQSTEAILVGAYTNTVESVQV
jgi:hypothetical protein